MLHTHTHTHTQAFCYLLSLYWHLIQYREREDPVHTTFYVAEMQEPCAPQELWMKGCHMFGQNAFAAAWTCIIMITSFYTEEVRLRVRKQQDPPLLRGT
jgi:hypothetical protein